MSAPLSAPQQLPLNARLSPFTLRVIPDPVLSEKTILVERLVEIPVELIRALDRGMRQHQALGMAAPQLGGRQRVCVVRWRAGIRVLINPRIIQRSDEVVICPREGCLSVPDFRTNTKRHRWVVVEFENETMTTVRERVSDLDAQIVQHEVDHLHGWTIVTGLPRQQRRQAERAVAAWSSKVRG